MLSNQEHQQVEKHYEESERIPANLFMTLPMEILVYILTYLELADLKAIKLVNKSKVLRSGINEHSENAYEKIWLERLREDFGLIAEKKQGSVVFPTEEFIESYCKFEGITKADFDDELSKVAKNKAYVIYKKIITLKSNKLSPKLNIIFHKALSAENPGQQFRPDESMVNDLLKTIGNNQVFADIVFRLAYQLCLDKDGQFTFAKAKKIRLLSLAIHCNQSLELIQFLMEQGFTVSDASIVRRDNFDTDRETVIYDMLESKQSYISKYLPIDTPIELIVEYAKFAASIRNDQSLIYLVETYGPKMNSDNFREILEKIITYSRDETQGLESLSKLDIVKKLSDEDITKLFAITIVENKQACYDLLASQYPKRISSLDTQISIIKFICTQRFLSHSYPVLVSLLKQFESTTEDLFDDILDQVPGLFELYHPDYTVTLVELFRNSGIQGQEFLDVVYKIKVKQTLSSRNEDPSASDSQDVVSQSIIQSKLAVMCKQKINPHAVNFSAFTPEIYTEELTRKSGNSTLNVTINWLYMCIEQNGLADSLPLLMLATEGKQKVFSDLLIYAVNQNASIFSELLPLTRNDKGHLWEEPLSNFSISDDARKTLREKLLVRPIHKQHLKTYVECYPNDIFIPDFLSKLLHISEKGIRFGVEVIEHTLKINKNNDDNYHRNLIRGIVAVMEMKEPQIENALLQLINEVLTGEQRESLSKEVLSRDIKYSSRVTRLCINSLSAIPVQAFAHIHLSDYNLIFNANNIDSVHELNLMMIRKMPEESDVAFDRKVIEALQSFAHGRNQKKSLKYIAELIANHPRKSQLYNTFNFAIYHHIDCIKDVFTAEDRLELQQNKCNILINYIHTYKALPKDQLYFTDTLLNSAGFIEYGRQVDVLSVAKQINHERSHYDLLRCKLAADPVVKSILQCKTTVANDTSVTKFDLTNEQVKQLKNPVPPAHAISKRERALYALLQYIVLRQDEKEYEPRLGFSLFGIKGRFSKSDKVEAAIALLKFILTGQGEFSTKHKEALWHGKLGEIADAFELKVIKHPDPNELLPSIRFMNIL